VTLGELESLFREGSPDSFIDKSQLLCSRLVVGSSRFEEKFEKRIIRPFIFGRKDEYIKQIFHEIESRHSESEETGEFNIKEDPGGLRDMEMILLAYKAKYELRQPICSLIFETLAILDSEHSKEIQELYAAFHFLKRVRDVYRLTVAATDTLSPDHMEDAARILGIVDKQGKARPLELLKRCRRTAEGVKVTLSSLMKAIDAFPR
jgi:UTP:GlnB (protein PII) uridylyltransferase